VAAYNAGEGTIQQAIEKNRRAGKPTDFWSLPLNKTTQGYVPQLLALSRIVADPQRYNFELPVIADTPYFVKINVDSQINLAEAAQNTSIDVSQLKKLNAGFNGWLTDPTGPHQLLVPVADAASFTLKLDSLAKGPRVKWAEHQVKKGESLDAIAKKYGVTADTIRDTNKLASNKLATGQRLQIALTPGVSTLEVGANETKTVAAGPKSNESATKTYIVKAGENLWSIAKAQKTSVNELARLNNINANVSLKPGQKLMIVASQDSKHTQDNDLQKLNYSIKSGDTLGKIAAQYKVSVKQIMEWNNIKDETSLRPQQELVIYAQANP
jgi:membrane-bound lytic murein transglycosylase D